MHVVHEHMRVTDEEKVRLLDEFECELQYSGHCCAACGTRDPSSEPRLPRPSS